MGHKIIQGLPIKIRVVEKTVSVDISQELSVLLKAAAAILFR